MLGWFEGRETEEGFEPSWLHRQLVPRVSGNTLNGVGESEARQPTAAYHRLDRWGPWFPVNLLFVLKQMWDVGPGGQFWPTLRDFWNKFSETWRWRNVAAEREEATPEAWTELVRAQAASDPHCNDVGITLVREELFFEGGTPDPDDRLTHAIVLLKHMSYDEMSATLETEDWVKVPFWRRKWVRSVREIMHSYANVYDSAVAMAQWIRQRGYRARAVGGAPGSDVNLLRTAIEAGLGELGKHGSIIHPRLGSTVRFAAVLTEMPLVVSQPADFGADSFCTHCRVCENACPPKAISPRKQLVRGVEKWYVNFDACVPYFNDTNGCGICITACPWSRPGIADNLFAKLARRRTRPHQGLRPG